MLCKQQVAQWATIAHLRANMQHFTAKNKIFSIKSQLESTSQQFIWCQRAEHLYILSHDRSRGRGWDPVKPV